MNLFLINDSTTLHRTLAQKAIVTAPLYKKNHLIMTSKLDEKTLYISSIRPASYDQENGKYILLIHENTSNDIIKVMKNHEYKNIRFTKGVSKKIIHKLVNDLIGKVESINDTESYKVAVFIRDRIIPKIQQALEENSLKLDDDLVKKLEDLEKSNIEDGKEDQLTDQNQDPNANANEVIA